MKTLLASLLLLWALAQTAYSDELRARPGFEWRNYGAGTIDMQVPVGWKDSTTQNGIVSMTRVSPEKNFEHGFNTGFTLNAMICKTDKEFNDAEGSSLQMADEHRKAFGTLIKQKFKNDDAMTYIMFEGERTLEKNPNIFHIRIVVHVLKKERMVFVYSFGALKSEWDEAWKFGVVMLNPMVMHLPKTKENNQAPVLTATSATPASDAPVAPAAAAAQL